MKRSTKAELRKVGRTSYFILLSTWTMLIAVMAINELVGRPLGYFGLSPSYDIDPLTAKALSVLALGAAAFARIYARSTWQGDAQPQTPDRVQSS